jgi:O-antigen ligase
MLNIISTILAMLACVALLLSPEIGILATYFSRPFVDTSWKDTVLVGFKLTELVSVYYPMVAMVIALLSFQAKSSLARMPLAKLWMAYLFFVTCFSLNIAINSSPADGASVFFRYMNGFAGFYLAQAYFHQEQKMKVFFLILALTGIFPLSQGIYEAITGNHWSVTSAEGETRNIGMYHDAITIRYYGLQTLLACAACLGGRYPRNNVMRTVLVVLAAASIFIVYNALSKAGLVILALWLVIWSYGRKSWAVPLISACATVVIIPLYFSKIVDTIYNQFHKEIGAVSGQISANNTFAGRWYLWEKMWKEWSGFTSLQKIFGSGQAAFGAHNDYIQMLFTGGYFGLAFYLTFLTVVGFKILKIYLTSTHLPRILALMAFTMWLVDAIGLVPSLYSGYQWFAWGVIGIAMRYDRNIKRSRSSPPKIVVTQTEHQDMSSNLLPSDSSLFLHP